jgi:hypothetical protein
VTFAAKGPPPGHGRGSLECQLLAGVDGSESATKTATVQAENDPSLITCASMRADELRGCLIREIFRAALIGMQAQANLLDGDDEAALDNLRRHWGAVRAGIGPLACELGALRKEGQ